MTTVFWNIAPCNICKAERRFRGAYCIHHQGYIPENYHLHTHLRDNLKSVLSFPHSLVPTTVLFPKQTHFYYCYVFLRYFLCSQYHVVKHYTYTFGTDSEVNRDLLHSTGFSHWLRKSCWLKLPVRHHTVWLRLLLSPQTLSASLLFPRTAQFTYPNHSRQFILYLHFL
jgi:hypothetical protein